MAKDDFDINFDFDQNDEFDPKSFLDDGGLDDDIDLNAFSDEDLGLSPQAPAAEDDFNLDVDLDTLLDMDAPSEEDVPSFAKRENNTRFNSMGYGSTPELPTDAEPTQLEDEPDYPEEEPAEEFPEEPAEDAAEPTDDEPQEEPRRRRERKAPQVKMPKVTMPSFLTKFFDLYFAPALNKELQEEPVDPNRPRRRRKTKAQIFKEFYLPPIVVCLTLILVLSFAVGSLTNVIRQKQIDRDVEQSRQESVQSAQEQIESESQAVLKKANRLAQGYDYQGAIDVLEDFLTTVDDVNAFPDINARHSELATEQSQLVAIQDASLIPNLSFHTLLNDINRAKQDPELGGKYNRNFVTTEEFSAILGQLYNNNYVLVDFDSFTANISGTIQFKPIYLPEGKKPVMLTETLVNYLSYMIDSNKDGEPDSGGCSVATRLVVTDDDEIKAEYVDGSGTTLTGNYDFVPILEDFIAEHPDFSYQGARAILAVCGKEGIFGYRINTSYQADKGEAYRNDQVAGAQKLVAALREKGYTLACYTYDNIAYGKINANQITNDLKLWTEQITPVLGNVDVMVYAQESDITDYGGNAFTVMNTSGFRYFVGNSSTPSTDVNTTYVRQRRLMVSGNSLAWHQDWFTGIFDPNVVLDKTNRGSVPN